MDEERPEPDGEPVRGTPEELKQRIEELQRPRKGDALFASGLGLVVSLGVTFVTTLIGSFYVGQMLDTKQGTTHWTPIAVVIGVAAGGYASWMLLQPFLKD